jgi:hypothetical protein
MYLIIARYKRFATLLMMFPVIKFILQDLKNQHISKGDNMASDIIINFMLPGIWILGLSIIGKILIPQVMGL